MDDSDFDVVIHALEIHREKLWEMSNSNLEWGAMDYIRMDQIAELDKAIAKLKEKNHE